MPARCALGCERTGVHRFPNYAKFPDQFKAWVRIMGGKLERPEDFKLYEHKRLCAVHFTQKDWNRNNRLNALAVPSLHLPINTEMASTVQVEEPVTSVATTMPFVPSDVNIVQSLTETVKTVQIDEPGTSFPSERPAVPIDVNIVQSLTETVKTVQTDEPGTSFTSEMPAVPIDARTNLLGVRSQITMEHNYCLNLSRKHYTKRRMPASEINDIAAKKQVKYLKREIIRLRKRGLSLKSRLQNALKISNNVAFKQVVSRMSEPAKLFMHMNFREANKKPKGRRFTTDEKILSLSIFKKSPRAYSLLSKYFLLPSKKSLKFLLSSVALKPGINDIIFNRIKKTVSSLNIEDTLCTLIFDEMSITPQVQYNIAKDVLEGFTTVGSNKICDHVLVFMIKGIKTNFKQPIAYYFTSSMKKTELKSVIVEVIKNVHSTGLSIVATVCDQSTINVSAINSLVSDTKASYLKKGLEWRYEHFEINKKKIIPIYDCPHLLKGIRNNLLTKDLTYIDHANSKKTIKWTYFEMLYAADKAYGELRCAQKLTEEHINPEKIKKMKVKSAAQIFSHSVAVATEHLSARGDIPLECRDLIPFIVLMDNLFDALNSSTFFIPNGKIYKAGIKRNSPHHDLFKKAIKLLKTTKYVAKKLYKGKIRFYETTVPSVTNYVKTIEAVQNLWQILNTKYSFDTLLTRNLNQDPLENFFGNIRSYGGRNVAPNCVNFEGAFKALLLNNYSSPHSIQSNCEEDNNTPLQNLKFFLMEKPNVSEEIPEQTENININFDIIHSFDVTVDEDKGQRNYVCGWVVTKYLKKYKGCKTCKKNLVSCNGDNPDTHKLIKLKEYNRKKKWLCYPSESAMILFQNIQKVTCAFIQKDVPRTGLKLKIKIFCDTVITTYPFVCSSHNLNEYFVDVTINLLICSWCRTINRILAGKIIYHGDDELKTTAQIYYNKHKNYKQRK